MRRKLILITLLSLILITLPVSKTGGNGVIQSNPVKVETKQMDSRALVLKDYLEKHNSPLQYNAQDFIDAADIYNLDWKLVPAISGVESTFGKAIPGGYNGWGWGVYGNQALGFKSWRDGIFTVSKGLKENYVDKGLTTPFSMNRVYAASPTWGSKVSYFIKDIDGFATNSIYSVSPEPAVKYNNVENKTAGTSAKLALKP